MRHLILLSVFAFLVSCKKEEIKLMADDMIAKRAAVEQVVQSGNYSVDNLLLAQAYFFNFAEKIHVIKADPEILNGVEDLIGKMPAQFCANFLLSRQFWSALDQNCRRGEIYICSVEMRDFPAIIQKFKGMLGSNLQSVLDTEPACRF